ncbi:MAG: serine/threonine-protein kinase [Polyangiales bacterium]
MEFPATLGSYTLVRRVAVGGMAEIFVGKTTGIGGIEKTVAIKVIHPRHVEDEEFVNMLIEEAKLSVLLNHQNIVQVLDLGRIDNTYFIVMEHVDGVDLHRLLRDYESTNSALPIDVALYIGIELCEALDYAHRRQDERGRMLNLVHRDVSPQNVLISRAGEVKLADFGIAKAAHRGADTGSGMIKGKYHYMSPEQAWAEPLDNRSDVYSTALVIWEALTGRMLHQDMDVAALVSTIRDLRPEPPSKYRPEVPIEVDEVILRALQPQPEARYQDADQFRAALSRVLSAVSGGSPSSDLASLVEESSKREAVVRPRRHSSNFPMPSLSKDEFTPSDHSVIFTRAGKRPSAPPDDKVGESDPTIVDDVAGVNASSDIGSVSREVDIRAGENRNSDGQCCSSRLLLGIGLGLWFGTKAFYAKSQFAESTLRRVVDETCVADMGSD